MRMFCGILGVALLCMLLGFGAGNARGEASSNRGSEEHVAELSHVNYTH
ncbi:MAG: hypothetical protein IJY65_04890 [Clostridia bacterium]|nr:hypothetical protein [Clostridia bacterium]